MQLSASPGTARLTHARLNLVCQGRRVPGRRLHCRGSAASPPAPPCPQI